MGRLSIPSALQFHRQRKGRNGNSRSDMFLEDGAAADPSSNKAAIKRTTRTRQIFSLVASASYILAAIFLILVLIGNINGSSVLGSLYFFRLELASVFSSSQPNAELLSSIARAIGLHDFYQAGLWNYCEGYNDDGITSCSTPMAMYWFNPIQILRGELLSGSTIGLPKSVATALGVLAFASHLMFGFFISGTTVVAVMAMLSPLALVSRWVSLPMATLSLIALALVAIASAIATVISMAFKVAITSQTNLNINASIGYKMMVIMWIATAFTAIPVFIHFGLGCCCTSRRDIKTGRKQLTGDGKSRKSRNASDTPTTDTATMMKEKGDARTDSNAS